MQANQALYLDGRAARKRSVLLAFQTDGMAILEDGVELAFWRYDELRPAEAPKGVMRLSATGAPELARLEVPDEHVAKAIEVRCGDLGRRRNRSEIATLKIVAWSLAAAVSLVITVVYLIPLFAERLAPFVPIAVEERLGEAVDSQVLALFGGEACEGSAGAAALATLTRQLEAEADLPMPATVAVLPTDTVNAIALPGGRVYVFNGLLELAENPDELAGVVAHELGHVAGRDGLKKLLQTSGSAFLLGLLFGDVTGGGAIVFGAQAMIDSSYSREVETEADAFAAELMRSLGRPPSALGTMLGRLGHGGPEALAFLSSHPVTADRIEALEAAGTPAPDGAPLLTDAEWRSLKAICGKVKG